MVGIVSEMNAIQFKLAVHFIPHVHLLISKYIIHTLSPKRDLWIRPVNAGANCHRVLSLIREYKKSVITFYFLGDD